MFLASNGGIIVIASKKNQNQVSALYSLHTLSFPFAEVKEVKTPSSSNAMVILEDEESENSSEQKELVGLEELKGDSSLKGEATVRKTLSGTRITPSSLYSKSSHKRSASKYLQSKSQWDSRFGLFTKEKTASSSSSSGKEGAPSKEGGSSSTRSSISLKQEKTPPSISSTSRITSSSHNPRVSKYLQSKSNWESGFGLFKKEKTAPSSSSSGKGGISTKENSSTAAVNARKREDTQLPTNRVTSETAVITDMKGIPPTLSSSSSTSSLASPVPSSTSHVPAPLIQPPNSSQNQPLPGATASPPLASLPKNS